MPLKRVRKQPDYSGQRKAKIFSWAVRLGILVVILGLLSSIGIIFYFFTKVPSPDTLSNLNQAQATKIYDRNGQLLYDIYADQNRISVKISDVPSTVKEATIAVEDKNFYHEAGFSVTGIARSVFNIIRYHQVDGGGSTITQQLVKNALLTSDQSIVRKIKELILAIEVEKYYTKDQILEMYLNTIPYGGTAYGVEAASNLYFGKDVKDLDLAQSAFIAGLPQRPSVYSPYGPTPDKGKARQKEVLTSMVNAGYISQKQADDAYNEQLTFRTSQTEQGIKAPHFMMYVKSQLEDMYGTSTVEEGGLRVTTTLDYNLQQQAEKTVKDQINNLGKYRVGNGAAVVMDPKTGDILAMVGSKDYFGTAAPDGCIPGAGANNPNSCVFDPNSNAALSLRQPGSSTKPITYALSFTKGYTASTVLWDVPTDFGTKDQPYKPVNYDGKWHGPVQVRYALANSFNIPAVKMLANVGIQNDMDLAYKMGISNWDPTPENVNNVGLSLVLGGRELTLLDLTDAYSVFADAGWHHDPVSILKVTDSSGKVLYENKPSQGTKILDPGVTYIISSILSDNAARTPEFGPNSVLNVKGKTVSVKTGTTDSKKDNWTVGYTPSFVVGVWVGNDNDTPMNQAIASGITGASPIWHDIMTAALAGKPDEKPKQPDDVVQATIDSLMGGAPENGEPTRSEYYLKGSVPTSPSSAYQHVNVCTNVGHTVANDGEAGNPADVIMPLEKDPSGQNKYQATIDGWVMANPDPKWVVSTKGCGTGPAQQSVVSISNISDGQTVPKIFDATATVNSPNGVKQLIWSVDGQQRATQTTAPYTVHIEFPDGTTGAHTLTATVQDNSGASFTQTITINVSS